MRRLTQNAFLTLAMTLPTPLLAASKDLGNGFLDHGVCVPISNHRGSVATVDGQNHNVFLQLLMDHRGGYELLLLDATDGHSEQFPIPFKNPKGDSPYAAILTSANKFYTHFGDNFVEFDPVSKAFTFSSPTVPQMSMAFTEDDHGLVWSVSYPDSGLCSFDPKTRKFTDYGHLNKETWPQYPRYIAVDDHGTVYWAVGNTASQIVAFNPKTRKATPLLAKDDRKTGTAFVSRDENGKVYAQALKGENEPWLELYDGKATKLASPPKQNPTKFITGSQALFHNTFPDGSTVKSSDLVNRKFTVAAKDGKTREFSFTYDSEGAITMGCAASPDGKTIVGGTAFPMRFFQFDPAADKMIDRIAHGQWNVVVPGKDRVFAASYPSGALLEYDPAKPWVDTKKDDPKTNPRHLENQIQDIHRPHCLLPLSDNNTVIYGGTPEYGYTGGGLSIFDRKANKGTLLTHKDLLPELAPHALLELPDHQLLIGFTTQPGTGGQRKAEQAEIGILDLKTRKLTWHAPLFKGAQEYTNLHRSPDGTIYGIIDSKILYTFDPKARKVLTQQDLTAGPSPLGITAHEQGPRLFVDTPAGDTYLYLSQGLAKLDPKTHQATLIAKSPEKIEAGSAYLNGRLYFIAGSHLQSYQLPK